MELLEEKLLRLRSENLGLRQLVLSCMPDRAEEVLKKCCDVRVPKTPVPAILHSGRGIAGTKKPAPVAKRPRSSAPARGEGKDSKDAMPNALTLMEQDFKMIASLRSSQQNFVLTDPTRPNNPIVYASAGFLAHTGHASGAVLGKSLDLLTGPATDGNSLDILNTNLAAGRETSLCLLCYRADATPFWGQLYVSALCDRAGNVTAHVACLSEVAQLPLDEFRRRLRRVPLPRDLLAQDAAAAAAAVDAAVDAAAAAADGAARGGTGGIAAAVRSAHGHYGSGAPAADALSRITLPPAYGLVSSGVSGRRVSGSSAGSSPGASALKVVDPLRRTRSAKRSSP
ncbi:hypothetical protein JKP88DRAFT_219323 [Tribonema minus]|uniref:PAS domain-containing protein n=1 Tax=Tribonema minus TaxID=303371 RepID=A0A835Z1S8_9STRA|nr:hypothetical protein JKP88DRAFT_219323 [Tribonema minus]